MDYRSVYKEMRKTSAIIRLAEILAVLILCASEFSTDMNVIMLTEGGLGSVVLILLIFCAATDFLLTVLGIFSEVIFNIHFAVNIVLCLIALIGGIQGVMFIAFNIFPFALYYFRGRRFYLKKLEEKEDNCSRDV
ncbi:MAG: hypothetical protein ACI4JA_10495 [Oscillospiraceae bacterium]